VEVRQREPDHDRQPQQRAYDHQLRQRGTVFHVHEEQCHQQHLAGRDPERHDDVERAQVDECHGRRQDGHHDQPKEDQDVVSRARDL